MQLYLVALLDIGIITRFSYEKRFVQRNFFIFMYKKVTGANGRLLKFWFPLKEKKKRKKTFEDKKIHLSVSEILEMRNLTCIIWIYLSQDIIRKSHKMTHIVAFIHGLKYFPFLAISSFQELFFYNFSPQQKIQRMTFIRTYQNIFV